CRRRSSRRSWNPKPRSSPASSKRPTSSWVTSAVSCRSAMIAGGHKSGSSQRRIVMDAVTPKANTAAEHSHVVRPADMEWKPTRFPGCEVKTLYMDPQTGVMTALMRFAPGAVLPDHEHVNIEQTYVLEGRLVDKEGPAKGTEARQGEFIWREAGSRHSAWCPEGGL